MTIIACQQCNLVTARRDLPSGEGSTACQSEQWILLTSVLVWIQPSRPDCTFRAVFFGSGTVLKVDVCRFTF